MNTTPEVTPEAAPERAPQCAPQTKRELQDIIDRVRTRAQAHGTPGERVQVWFHASAYSLSVEPVAVVEVGDTRLRIRVMPTWGGVWEDTFQRRARHENYFASYEKAARWLYEYMARVVNRTEGILNDALSPTPDTYIPSLDQIRVIVAHMPQLEAYMDTFRAQHVLAFAASDPKAPRRAPDNVVELAHRLVPGLVALS